MKLAQNGKNDKFLLVPSKNHFLNIFSHLKRFLMITLSKRVTLWPNLKLLSFGYTLKTFFTKIKVYRQVLGDTRVTCIKFLFPTTSGY